MPLAISFSCQRREGSLSQSNCTDSMLFSVLTSLAIVTHLACLALTSNASFEMRSQPLRDTQEFQFTRSDTARTLAAD